MIRTIDRWSPCDCGSMAARELNDGAWECPVCGSVEQ